MSTIVRLTSSGGTVNFKITPKITESRVTQYVDVGLQSASGIAMYTVTDNRKYSINAMFASRTEAEALENYRYIHLLKSWHYPEDDNGEAKPLIVKLSGYRNQFQSIPMVLSSLTIDFPDDVDYIHTSTASVPIIQTVNASFIEAHSTDEGEAFSIERFRQGLMPGF